jgi:hypothetical protein
MNLAVIGLFLLHAVELPAGSAPQPVAFPHFPDTVHAFVWTNWQLVPIDRMAAVLEAEPAEVAALGAGMGLPEQPVISEDQWARSYITIIRRNWHLLPYDQLLELLGWDAEKLAYTLREDDFLFIKLGNLKPSCPPLKYAEPAPETAARAQEIAALMRQEFPNGLYDHGEGLFDFVDALSAPPEDAEPDREESLFSPRFCSAYFAMYGDPFMEDTRKSYPGGYLERLARSGVNGVWLQCVLYKMAPFPWDPARSEDWKTRLKNLKTLTARAKEHGIGIYLYLNEPRAMPLSFHKAHPGLRGVTEGDYATLCTSVPEVEAWLTTGVRTICEAVPELAGFFTITASENLTHCWSHFNGGNCPRCADRGAEAVIAGVNGAIHAGIEEAGADARLIAWDWGWRDGHAEGIVSALPRDVALMSVSEWSTPVTRGGVNTAVGEYSISVVGPGPRATRHWAIARDHGHETIAKVQANNTWELSALPWIPALENVARHAFNLRQADVSGIMLGWTLGGCPSPNLEVFAEMGRPGKKTVDGVLRDVAERRFGPEAAPHAVTAWKAFSRAFREFPYHGSLLYRAPLQMGPANPFWPEKTGYASTMVGLPYDDLTGWRAIFPPDVFIRQFAMMGDGFENALHELQAQTRDLDLTKAQRMAIQEEMDMARVCAIHYHSAANQARFVQARDALADTVPGPEQQALLDRLAGSLRSSIQLARQLHEIQVRDSRIGFEASNHYFYVPLDLAAKVINCRWLLDAWLPAQSNAVTQ